MIESIRRALPARQRRMYSIILAVLLSAAAFGYRASPIWIGLPIGIGAIAVVLRKPLLGLFLLIVAALLGPIAISTGTEVSLNMASLLVPALFIVWLLISMSRHDIRLIASPTTKPMILFLVAGLISLFISNVIWDPEVPRRDYFILVQFGQWGIFFFSACAFWLVGNLIRAEVWLRRLTATFLLLGGVLAIVRMLPGGWHLLDVVATFAINRAPFWMLLTTLAAGQLMFNRELSTRWRMFLVAVLCAVALYAFGDQQERSSYWVSIVVIVGVLLWLRLPKWRWVAVSAVAVLAASGVLFQVIYTFAGGDAKWKESGASREVLIGRVLEDSMRNPITGIGPAAYHWYGMTRPLGYEGAWWVQPQINSHNNYVDLFSQTGIIGLALFLWFMFELFRVGRKLHTRYIDGFAGGYIASMLGAWLSIMVIMALADWFLPFVYNIGFPGFQASVLVWMFFGGFLFYEGLEQQPAVKTQP